MYEKRKAEISVVKHKKLFIWRLKTFFFTETCIKFSKIFFDNVCYIYGVTCAVCTDMLLCIGDSCRCPLLISLTVTDV